MTFDEIMLKSRYHGQERQIHPRMKRAEAWKPFRDENKSNSDFNNVEFRVFDEIENSTQVMLEYEKSWF